MKKEFRKVLRGMEIGQSIIDNLTGTEFVKTKYGFKSSRGNKYKENEIIERLHEGYTII